MDAEAQARRRQRAASACSARVAAPRRALCTRPAASAPGEAHLEAAVRDCVHQRVHGLRGARRSRLHQLCRKDGIERRERRAGDGPAGFVGPHDGQERRQVFQRCHGRPVAPRVQLAAKRPEALQQRVLNAGAAAAVARRREPRVLAHQRHRRRNTPPEKRRRAEPRLRGDGRWGGHDAPRRGAGLCRARPATYGKRCQAAQHAAGQGCERTQAAVRIAAQMTRKSVPHRRATAAKRELPTAAARCIACAEQARARAPSCSQARTARCRAANAARAAAAAAGAGAGSGAACLRSAEQAARQLLLGAGERLAERLLRQRHVAVPAAHRHAARHHARVRLQDDAAQQAGRRYTSGAGAATQSVRWVTTTQRVAALRLGERHAPAVHQLVQRHEDEVQVLQRAALVHLAAGGGGEAPVRRLTLARAALVCPCATAARCVCVQPAQEAGTHASSMETVSVSALSTVARMISFSSASAVA